MGNSSGTGKLYMIQRYTWNGHQADLDDVFPTLDSSLALMKMWEIHRDNPEFDWETGEDGDLISRGPSQYDYTRYSIAEMPLDEEL